MGEEEKPRGGSFLIQETEPANVFSPEDFSEEQRMFAKTAEDFINNEVVPRIDETEAGAEGVMPGLVRKSGELGLLMIDVPEKYGGLGSDKATSMLVSEVVSKGGAFASAFGAHTGIGTLPIVYFGTEAQKQKYLPGLASGETLSCYALTEAGSGSDALAARARAELTQDGKFFKLNGEKLFVTNGGFADLFIVFAKVNGEDFSAFILERGYEGVNVGAEEDKLGIKGSSTVTLALEDAKVPVENLLGEQGKGHKIAFNILNIGRFKLGVGSVGAAKQAFQDAVKYANDRQQFGQPIASFGMIQNKIADMACGIYVAESMSYRTAGLIDGVLGSIDKDSEDAPMKTIQGIEEYSVECSIMKVMGSEMLDFVVDETLQIFGGYGYSKEYPAERYYRDARISRIYEGTNEINRLVIPLMLVRRAMKGLLPLMPAAKKLQDELLDFPSPAEEMEETFLSVEAGLVTSAKKAALLAAGVALQKYMDKIRDRQGILGCIADTLIEVYAMESALLRARKIRSLKGDENTDITAKMTSLYIYDAVGRVDRKARETLAASAKGDELRTMLAALRRLLRHVPVDLLAERVGIAEYFTEEGGYKI